MAGGPSEELVNLDYGMLTGVLGREMDALADAQGDVIGATEGLRLPRQKLELAEQALVLRRQELAEGLAGLDLVGHTIHFEEGVSRGNLDRASLTKNFFINGDTRRDLRGASGIILGAELGTVEGVPVTEKDEIVFHVFVPPEFPHNQVVVANEAVYNIVGVAPPPNG